jgi:hypothetical protein
MGQIAGDRQRANCDCGAGGATWRLRSAAGRAPTLPMPTRSRRQPDLPAVILEQPAAMAFVDA